MVRITQNLANRLGPIPKTSERVFDFSSLRYLSGSFRKQRKRIAERLQNPRILQIHFHTIRHWKASITYAQKPDILYVMGMLGHKSIRNTMTYVHIANTLFSGAETDYVVKVAASVGDAVKVVEKGFEYVTGNYDDGGKVFRKRKSLYVRDCEESPIGGSAKMTAVRS